MARRPQRLRSATSSSAGQPYCPQKFDIVFLDFDPQAGREQAGRRPGFVLSDERYNRIARLCLICPITSQIKGYPFEVTLPAGLATTGAVLCDRIKSLSWDQRRCDFVEKCPTIAPEVLGRVRALLGL